MSNEERYCLNCNGDISNLRRRHKFCNKLCYLEFLKKYKEKKLCLHCGKELNSKYSKKFCNHTCSCSYWNKNREINRDEVNKKISDSMKQYYNSENDIIQQKKDKAREIISSFNTPESNKKKKEKYIKKFYTMENWPNMKKTARRNFLIALQGGRCKQCDLDKWNNRDITLQLHHIDGNSNNNSFENCVMLCPNCHSMTYNFGGKSNYKNRLKYSDEEIAAVLRESNSIVETLRKINFNKNKIGYARIKRIIKENNIEHLFVFL